MGQWHNEGQGMWKGEKEKSITNCRNAATAAALQTVKRGNRVAIYQQLIRFTQCCDDVIGSLIRAHRTLILIFLFVIYIHIFSPVKLEN